MKSSLVNAALLVACFATLTLANSQATTQATSVSSVIEPYEDWWYRCRAFPSEAQRAQLEAFVAAHPKEPSALFWLSEDLLRRNFGLLSDADASRRRDLLREAANIGYAAAKARLAEEILDGSRITGERAEALRMLQETSRELETMYVLGTLCVDGSAGIPVNLEKAQSILMSALRLGHLRAAEPLARCLAKQGEYDRAIQTATRPLTRVRSTA